MATEFLFALNSARAPQPALLGCKSAGCVGVLVGLRGSDGAELWNLPTKQEVFELNCRTLDVDNDGRLDCLAAGRRATLLAVDPRTGKHLWPPQTGSEPHLENDWNIYSPLTLPDLNGDGVGEVFVAHGGDPLFPPDNHTRFPARFMVLSGADGRMLGNFFQSPDGKETYNSPVLHATRDGRPRILFGTGGETVNGPSHLLQREARLNGSLYAIPTDELLCLTGFKRCTSPTASFILELYKSTSKGIMVPIVLADVSGDGTDDVVCISFDGTVVVLDGKTYSVLWRRFLPNYESYATPAIGYFNDDERLDVMTVWNLGQWPEYSQCLIIVMDGRTGDTLWSFTTSRSSMASPLVLRTVEKQRDAFVVVVEGRAGDYMEDTVGVVHGIDPQRKLAKVEQAEQKVGKRSIISCAASNLDLLAVEVLLVDSSSLNRPVRVWRREVDKFYYDPVSYAAVNISSIAEGMLTALGCEIMQQTPRNTGAIGDVDGDGLLDLILPFGARALLMKDGHYFDERMDMEIVKISLEKYLRSFPTIELNSTYNYKSQRKTLLQAIGFLPAAKQPWTAYMGTRGDSVYRHD